MKSKTMGLLFVVSSVYYLLSEALCAYFFHDTLLYTYIFHTISELGIPNSFSPLSSLMNSAFIVIGLTLMMGNFFTFKDYIIKNRKMFYVFTAVTSIGVMIVGLVHGGNPLTSGYHTLGAVMAILGGNILLVLISKSMKEFNKYQKITLVLGLVGILAFWIMFFNMKNIYMPVFERLSVYTLIIWCLYTGISYGYS